MPLPVSASPVSPPRSARLSVVSPRADEKRVELDEDVFRRAQRGEADALEAFVRMYQNRLLAFLSRGSGRGDCAEDLAQEVFLRAIRALPRFQWGGAKISTWLFQIAVHLMRDRAKVKVRDHVPMPNELLDRAPSPEESCEQRRILARVEESTRALPEDQRVALLLFEFHGLTHDEIAQVTGAPAATVKTRIFRARATLKKTLLGRTDS